MTRPVYAEDYLGRRFDPRLYNCWHFVVDVWEDMTGARLPELEIRDEELLEAVAARQQGSGRFRKLEGLDRDNPPVWPAIALFLRHRGAQPPHVGTWLRGQVLHLTSECGVRYDRLEWVCPGFPVTFWVPAEQLE